VLRCSSIYESDPVGPVQDQPPFFNLATEVLTSLEPRSLLRRCQEVEGALGRRRELEQQKGPRTMDVDLLLMGPRVERWPELELPHPELARRAFVVLPLLELQPGLLDPRDGRPLSSLAGALEAEQRIMRVEPPPQLSDDDGEAPCEPVNLFTVSALRLHRSDLPPTPGRCPSLRRRLLRRIFGDRLG
jgi:2-amino-4-hydroxy-6-hydroxymethyldihydropteridine diphosphokinase